MVCNMKLHNKVDKKILREQLHASDEERTTISFYKYASIKNPEVFRDHLYVQWDELDIYGRVHVANEGINAQLSIPTKHFNGFVASLKNITFLENVRLNFAFQDNGKSFFKLVIKARDKILADGLEDQSFDSSNKGQHLHAKEWNKLMEDPNSILIDMRNHYESEVGHFDGAIAPDVDTFASSLDVIDKMMGKHKDKNIMMYCTGGIRCEKASAWYKHKGYKNVYQLEGGIVKYAHEVQDEKLDNKFKGKNFVFDERLGETIGQEVIARCHQCGKTCDTHVNCKNVACNLLFIQCEACVKSHENTCSEHCQSTIKLPEGEQHELRKGKKAGDNIFKKGRSPHLKYKQEINTKIPEMPGMREL